MSEPDRVFTGVVEVADGVSLAFEVRGEVRGEARGGRPAIALIMGLGGHRGDWGEPFLRALAAGLTVVAFDARGTGGSSKPRAPTSIAQMAADARAVIEHVGLGTTHVMGMSMGGAVAMQLALDAPRLVASLVLCSTSPGGPSAFAPTERAAAAMAPRKNVSPEVVVRDRIAALMPPGFAEAHPDVIEHAMRASLAAPTPMYAWRAQLEAVLSMDLRAELHRLSMPVTVVHGEADPLVRFDQGRAIAAAIPQARTRWLPAGGHLLSLEQPAELAALVIEHVASVAPSTR